MNREWPPVGTRLTAEYHGQVYTAVIVTAWKRLKSDKQIVLTSGPSKGRRCDNFTEAAMLATSRQRREQRLRCRGVGNGWEFWAACPPAGHPAVNQSAA